MKKRVMNHALGIMVMLLASLLFFQNCAPQRLEAEQGAFASQQELDERLVRALKSAPDADAICESLESYTCEARMYGPGLENAVLRERACFDGGCVEVLSLSFDTENQIAACKGCSEKEIQERYDYDSLVCMNRRLPVGRMLPLRGEGDDVEAAIKAAKVKCRALAKGAR